MANKVHTVTGISDKQFFISKHRTRYEREHLKINNKHSSKAGLYTFNPLKTPIMAHNPWHRQPPFLKYFAITSFGGLLWRTSLDCKSSILVTVNSTVWRSENKSKIKWVRECYTWNWLLQRHDSFVLHLILVEFFSRSLVKSNWIRNPIQVSINWYE